MKKIIFLFFSFVCQIGIAQEETANQPTLDKKEEVIIEDAKFEGGIEFFLNKIYEQFDFGNVKPKDLEEFKKQSKKYFYVRFVIDEYGNPINITSPNIDNKNSLFLEAKRVIALNKWKPAKVNGEPIRERLVLPIVVSLE